MIRIPGTIICPEGLIPAGRQLASCTGLSAADEDTFALIPMVRARWPRIASAWCWGMRARV